VDVEAAGFSSGIHEFSPENLNKERRSDRLLIRANFRFCVGNGTTTACESSYEACNNDLPQGTRKKGRPGGAKHEPALRKSARILKPCEGAVGLH